MMLRLLVGLLIWLALPSPGSTADAWALWQKKEGQVGGRFKDTWTLVGGYESQRECRATRSEILARLRRTHVATHNADAVTVEDPLGWRLTYTCLPGGVHPR